jgi:ribosomal protein S18 acetylase RimI-like enzyme
MLKLIPMTEADFQRFMTHSPTGYAADIQSIYGLDASAALEQANDGLQQLLPEGIHTPDQHFFTLASATGDEVGLLWFGVESDTQPHVLFIYDLEIHPQFRRQGLATEALNAAQEWAKQRGITRMELNVFAHNHAALALYKAAAFETCEMTLGKNLY